MKWRDRKQSTNVDDRRSETGTISKRGGPSLGTLLYLWPLVKPLLRSKLGIVILGVGAFVYFGNFISLPGSSDSAKPSMVNQEDEELAAFIKTIHGDTEAIWSGFYAQMGAQYPSPTLVLYRGSTRSGCGPASSRMGPFYCPTDQKIYVDLGFFEDLKRQHNAGGDFAQAYVLAHEVGHHIQNLEGTLSQVQRAKQSAFGEGKKNALQVRVELQADCFAGLWAYHANKQFGILEEGDLEEALVAASAIGDDRLQKQSQGFSIPHTFTHGSSAQRVEWFNRGFKNGNLADCDTFAQ
jgi:predicted metalloprotease